MDILLDDTNDLQFDQSGDILIGDPDVQDQKLLLLTGKNDWKENPTIGVGLEEYLEDENTELLLQEIREQYKMCGMEVKSIKQVNGKYIIERK